MIKIKERGNFKRTEKLFKKCRTTFNEAYFVQYADKIKTALEEGTPKDSGETAMSWSYDIEISDNAYTINFYNSNVKNGCNIALILQYGHATRNGGWIEGIDYINPAIRPYVEDLAKDMWREVTAI